MIAMTIIITVLMMLPACGGARFISAGDEAPNFKLTTPSGVSKSLSDYKGSNILLIFEQIPCTNCDTQRPYIQDGLKPAGIDVTVISIYCDNSPATVDKDIKEKNLENFGVALVDPESAVGAQYGCGKAYPYNMLIDANGIVKAVKIGPFTSAQEVTSWLKSLQQ
jgi:peroxiredoxin